MKRSMLFLLFISVLLLGACRDKTQEVFNSDQLDPAFFKSEWVKKAYILEIGKEPNEALLVHFYDKAIEENPKNVYAYFKRGIYNESLKKEKEAEADYTSAIKIIGNFEPAYYRRGTLLSEKGRYTEAIVDLTTAIALSPSHAQAYNNRAYTYFKMGKLDLAQEDIKTALIADPKSGYAYSTLAEIEWTKGNKEAFYTNIELAMKNQFPAWKYSDDPVFLPLKMDARFIAIVDAYKPLDKGALDGKTYQNKFFNFTFQVPKKWVILDEARMPKNRANLISIYKREQGTPATNPSCLVMAEPMDHPGVATSVDYIQEIKKTLEKSKEPYTFSKEIAKRTIGTIAFDVLTATCDIYPTSAQQFFYVAIIRKHVFIIVTTYYLDEEAQEIEEILKNIEMTPLLNRG